MVSPIANHTIKNIQLCKYFAVTTVSLQTGLVEEDVLQSKQTSGRLCDYLLYHFRVFIRHWGVRMREFM